MFMYSCDKDVLEQCRKVEYDQKYVKHLKDENKSLKANNNKLKASNADKDDLIAKQAARLAYLEAQLNQNK
jgi:cell division protein FtsB